MSKYNELFYVQAILSGKTSDRGVMFVALEW